MAIISDSSKHSLSLGPILAPRLKQTEIQLALPRSYTWTWKNPILKLEMKDQSIISVPLGELPSGARSDLGAQTPASRAECFFVPDLQAAQFWGGGLSKPGQPFPGFLVEFHPPLIYRAASDLQAAVGLLDTDTATGINGFMFMGTADSKVPPGSFYTVSRLAPAAHSVRIGVRRAKFHTEENTFEFPNCQLVSKFGGTGFQVDSNKSFTTPTGWVVTLAQQYSGPHRNVKRDSKSIEISLGLRPPAHSRTMPDGSPRPNCFNLPRDMEAEQFAEVELVSPTAQQLGLTSVRIGSKNFPGSTSTGMVHYGSFNLKVRVRTTSIKELGIETMTLPVKPYKG